MKFIYIQTIVSGKKPGIPFRICFIDNKDYKFGFFTIHPQKAISSAIYTSNRLERLEIINAPPFCTIADELIDVFKGQQLIFKDNFQFKLLKSLFKAIGYNFMVKPRIIWNTYDINKLKAKGVTLPAQHQNSLTFAENLLREMVAYTSDGNELKAYGKDGIQSVKRWDWSQYRQEPGVYFFFNAAGDIIYVGKAKTIRKRLQNHFSNHKKSNKINYSEVTSIDVNYTGNDFIAQLVETTEIKQLKPKYNAQQRDDSAPFIINPGATAKGIKKLKIVRKDYADNFPEKYYNRNSVKHALEKFCTTYNLCRKHCGVETVKGPCSVVTVLHNDCVCNGNESIADYNERFHKALSEFHNIKSRKLYKLQGRYKMEDAFVYSINGIYQGYGFIDKSEFIGNENDILGYLIQQKNNYESSRVLDVIERKIARKHILYL